MNSENLFLGDNHDELSSQSQHQLQQGGTERTNLELNPAENDRPTLDALRSELAKHSFQGISTSQNQLIFSPDRFRRIASLTPDERHSQFSGNITALQNLAGDVELVPKNPLVRAGGAILEAIRFPLNPIENTKRLNESIKKLARKLHLVKDTPVPNEIPKTSITLDTHPQVDNMQITKTLLQMRRDSLPYDGKNPIIDLIVNKYAKKNINMSAAKTIAWFAASNIPIIGFVVAAGKLYLPNVVAPLYDRKFVRAAKTIFLTGTDFAANFALSVKAGLMAHDTVQLFATRGLIGGLLGLPLLLAENWQVVAPYPVLLAYNPLFIQGRLDRSDYRRYAHYMEAMGDQLWNNPPAQQEQVIHGVNGMLADYGKSHPGNSIEQNISSLSTLMQHEYAALTERLTDETNAITILQDRIQQTPDERHSLLEREIMQLSLRNKAYRARLLFIENLYLLMQTTRNLSNTPAIR